MCLSLLICPEYSIGYKDGKSTLTNRDEAFFTITELEVWEVKEIE